jgi:hypothetical protein
MRAWRYGDPEASRPRAYRDLTGVRFGALVALERGPGPATTWVCACECGRTVTVRAWSLTRGEGHGAQSCGDRARHHRRDVVGYGPAHERVRADRGEATDQACVDCGRPAAQWSYDHTDPDALQAPEGRFSLDVARYVPRCVSCHKRVDLARLEGRTLHPPRERPTQGVLFSDDL